MPSTFSGLNIGFSGLYASRYALDVTGHNIANANTEGFSRQSLRIAASRPFAAPALSRSGQPGQVGTGVSVLEIQRSRDGFIRQLIQKEQGNTGAWEAKAQTLEQIELLFAEPSENGIGYNLDEFFSSLHDLARDADDTAVREVVLQRAAVLADNITHAYFQLSEVHRSTSNLVDVKTTELNTYAKEVADLNFQIAGVLRIGDQPNDLMDQRDLIIEKMSRIADITVYDTGTGSLNVALDGVNIVQEYETREVEALINPENGVVQGIKWKDFGSQVNIKSGELAGLIETNTEIVPRFMEQMNQLAFELARNVNDLHAQGYDLDGKSGGLFFVDRRTPVEGPVMPLKLDDPKYEVAKYIGLNPTLTVRTIAAAKQPPDAEGPKTGDGDNALSMAELADARVLLDGTATMSDFYNGMISNLGVDSQRAQLMKENQGLVLDNLKNWDSSISGVSIDEEVASLVKFQHSYSASARMITTVDEMIDVIINRLGTFGR